MTIEQWVKDLSGVTNKENIKINESLKKYTMTKLGGNADILVIPETEEEVEAIVQYTYSHQIPLLILGNGSNMIVRDGGVRGIVMNLSKLNQIKIEGTEVYAQSGALIMDVSKKAAEASLTGLEFACGIPGSVGGAMAMNAGAYGGEINDIIVHSTVLTKEGKRLVLSKEELELGYRKSIIAQKNYIVLSSLFRLEKGNKEEIDAKIADLTYKRQSKQPLEYPSAGSVFKRPPGYFAGKLIQDCGLQGKGLAEQKFLQNMLGLLLIKEMQLRRII